MKGTYLLILHMESACQQLRIGRLGCYDFVPGYYLYVGSAFGAGGLAARLGYHRRRVKVCPHWHIDYLRLHTDLREVWALVSEQRLEQRWCGALMSVPGIQMPVRGFGSSDTSDPTHLFFLPTYPYPCLLSPVLLPASFCDNLRSSSLVLDIERYSE